MNTRKIQKVPSDMDPMDAAIYATNLKISRTGFYVRKYNPDVDFSALQMMNQDNKEYDCMDISNVSGGDALLAIHSETNSIAAYLFFTAGTTRNSNKGYVAIALSCTDKKYRRKRLSTYLRMTLFLAAIQDGNAQFIVSDVNADSHRLLSKYGFKGDIAEYLEDFNWEYTMYVDIDKPKFRKGVDDFFY